MPSAEALGHQLGLVCEGIALCLLITSIVCLFVNSTQNHFVRAYHAAITVTTLVVVVLGITIAIRYVEVVTPTIPLVRSLEMPVFLILVVPLSLSDSANATRVAIFMINHSHKQRSLHTPIPTPTHVSVQNFTISTVAASAIQSGSQSHAQGEIRPEGPGNSGNPGDPDTFDHESLDINLNLEDLRPAQPTNDAEVPCHLLPREKALLWFASTLVVLNYLTAVYMVVLLAGSDENVLDTTEYRVSTHMMYGLGSILVKLVVVVGQIHVVYHMRKQDQIPLLENKVLLLVTGYTFVLLLFLAVRFIDIPDISFRLDFYLYPVELAFSLLVLAYLGLDFSSH
jgi:Ca2+/Na+ antiporter